MESKTTVIDTADAAHPRFCRKQIVSTRTGFKIGLIQLAVGADKAKNIANAVKQIELAKKCGASIVALPECFNSPYGTQFFKEYAEEVPCGQTSSALSKAAIDNDVYIIGGTIPEKCDDKLYNTCAVFDNCGNFVVKHRKLHLFDIDIPGKIRFQESETLTAGDHLTSFEFQNFKIGLGICYDLRFEEMAKLYNRMGCKMLIFPGAFNMTTGPKHWELLARARATDNQCYVALISPARDESASYVAWGHTCVVSPWGEVQGQLEEKEDLLVYDVDPAMVDEVRSQIPISVQRRTDIYDTKLCEKL